MSEKVKLTKVQVSHIESWTDSYSKANLVKTYIQEPERIEHIEGGVISMNLDTLIRALYIGYEIEETPEDKVRALYAKYSNGLIDTHYRAAFDMILEALEIKIEGVNA